MLAGAGPNLFLLLLAPGSERQPMLVNGFSNIVPDVSPDGRWMAYASNESGRYEVYVRPFSPAATERWRVSQEGGVAPKWGPDGRVLFYVTADRRLVGFAVQTDSDFKIGAPVRAFEGPIPALPRTNPVSRQWDLTPDGRRMLLIKNAGSVRDNEMVVVQHWFEELKRKVPAP